MIHLREEDTTNDDPSDHLSLIPTTTISSSSLTLSFSSSSSRTLSFLPESNDEITIPSPLHSPFRTFSLTFRAFTQICTLVQFNSISLTIDADGYLALVIRQHQAQRIFAQTNRQLVNDGQRHTIHLQLIHNKLQAWIDPMKKISIELTRLLIIVDRFVFGAYNQYLGCIEHVIYNDQSLLFTSIPLHRQECLRGATLTHQIISFEEFDPPVIVLMDFPEELQSFSFRFSTTESNSLLCTLNDLAHQHVMTLNIRQRRLLLTYHQQRMELWMNQSIVHGIEHNLIIKILNKNDFILQFDQHIMLRKISISPIFQKITFGQISSVYEKTFLGCIGDILYNGKSLLKWEHIHPLGRLSNTCRSSKHTRK